MLNAGFRLANQGSSYEKSLSDDYKKAEGKDHRWQLIFLSRLNSVFQS